MALLKPDVKNLFLKIHEEYDNQFTTLRGETPYSEALLDLQQQLLENPQKIEMIEHEFQKLKQEFR